MMKTLQGGLGEIYENSAQLFLSQPKTYGLFPNFKTWMLGVQLRCLNSI